MDTSNNGVKNPCSFQPRHHHHDGGHHPHRRRHHHHFFYISPHCHLHRSILHPNNHSPSCSFSPLPQNPESVASIPSNPNETFDDASMPQDEIEKLELDEEPIFVLTDEWRDFFAKSEAKRRQAKQAKKGKK